MSARTSPVSISASTGTHPPAHTFLPLKEVSKGYGTIRIRNQIRIRNLMVLIRESGSLPKCHRSSTLANRTPSFHQQECQIVLVGSGTCARGVPLLPTPPFNPKNDCKLVTIMINSEHTLKVIHFVCTTASSVAFLSDHISSNSTSRLRYVCERSTTPPHPALPP